MKSRWLTVKKKHQMWIASKHNFQVPIDRASHIFPIGGFSLAFFLSGPHHELGERAPAPRRSAFFGWETARRSSSEKLKQEIEFVEQNTEMVCYKVLQGNLTHSRNLCNAKSMRAKKNWNTNFELVAVSDRGGGEVVLAGRLTLACSMWVTPKSASTHSIHSFAVGQI